MNVNNKKKITGPAIWMAGLFFALLFALSADSQRTETSQMGQLIGQYLSEQTENSLLMLYVPVFSFVEEENISLKQVFVENQFNSMMPLYSFCDDSVEEASQVEDRMTIEMILLAEANEEAGFTDEEVFSETPDGMPEDIGAGAQGDNPNLSPADGIMNELGQTAGDGEGSAGGEVNLDDLLMAENQAAGGIINNLPGSSQFVPHIQQAQVDRAALRDYETLVKNFYTVDKNTMIGSDQLNVDTLGSQDMTVSKDAPGPQILIYHTHSQETFADSVPNDPSTSIVGVGDNLARILTETYGYQVLHHTGQYDVQSRDDAYSKSLPAIEQVLAENPSIQVVIDLHRDAMAEQTHLVMDLDGRPTARFMFFNGLSRTKKTGNISYLYNENLGSNLAFSYQMQMKAAEYYPGLTRKIYLKGYRYNMHLRSKTLLVELGAQNNSVEEVMNACDPLAHILDMVLGGG